MRVTVLAGGLGGAKFIEGLRQAQPDAEITVVGNTADDIWLFGLKICPDLDTLMYLLGGGLDRQRGWGRAEETFAVSAELRAYDAKPDWFGLGDRDLATHLLRTQMLNAGYPLSTVTAALCERWNPGVTLLPMSDDRVETHVVVEVGEEPQAMHFQQWWVGHRAELPAKEFVMIGSSEARPGPGVLEAIADADAIFLPPSNPVVSIGAILSVPGIAEALRAAAAPVVGVSGIIAGRPVRGMADACLAAIGVECSSTGVARHFGARPAGLLDAWLMDNADADAQADVAALGLRTMVRPTLMPDVDAATSVARSALELADSLGAK